MLISGNIRRIATGPPTFQSSTSLQVLSLWSYTWQRTADGRGRVYQPRDRFHGSIACRVDALLGDARGRNQAFFDRAGISGKSYFTAA